MAKLFADFAGDDLKGKSVAFIPTAAIHEKVNFYVKSGRKALEKMGMVVDELEVSSAPESEICGKLCSNDYIYLTGGNTFFLLQELRKTGADKVVAEQIALGKMFIGESADSMILAPNIEYVISMDDYETASELMSYDALSIVDFGSVNKSVLLPFLI